MDKGKVAMKGKWRDKEFEITRVGTSDGYLYDLSEVELLDNLDYWEKLKHQYAGMAMSRLVELVNHGYEYVYEEVAILATNYATALVEKLKESKV